MIYRNRNTPNFNFSKVFLTDMEDFKFLQVSVHFRPGHLQAKIVNSSFRAQEKIQITNLVQPKILSLLFSGC